jgi:lysophospholipase L1-like esterase
LAHGDSITCGCYDDVEGQPATPYPTFLEQRLDSSVGPSEVINSGKPGEKARAAAERLQASLQTYLPQYVLIMEGTNDVSREYSAADTAYHIKLLVWEVTRESGIDGVEVVLATLTPRLDHHNPLLQETNVEIAKVARGQGLPLADQWQAFQNYGNLEDLFVLDPLEPGSLHPVHPNSTGLKIIADTFYQTMVNAGLLPDDTTPPTAWITSLPPQSECAGVNVAWNGDDGDGSGIGSFDVQVQDNSGPWTDWLLGTPAYSGTYVGAPVGHTLGFRVRARDQVGNIGDYSPKATTQVVDNTPPDLVSVTPLLPYRMAPFTVSWWGYDRCSQVTKYDVEYRVGSGSWKSWLIGTGKTSASFNP